MQISSEAVRSRRHPGPSQFLQKAPAQALVVVPPTRCSAEFHRPLAPIYTAVGVLVGIRSKERSEHTWLPLLGRGLCGCLPFDHNSWRRLLEHFDKGFHLWKPARPVAARMREQYLGIRHPLVGWDWEVSLLELCEHAGLCLPVFAHTEKRSSIGRPQRVPPSERNCH